MPVPPLQTPPVAPITEPLKAMAEALAQTVPFVPASTIGAGVKVMVRLLVAGVQLPLPVVVRINVTEPLLISAAVGV